MGKRGPLPKPQAHGHRIRNPGTTLALPSKERQIPAVSKDWSATTRAAWRAYWRDDVSVVAREVDMPSLRRLFGMYDQRARAQQIVDEALVVRGSTGQVRTNPLADHVLKLETAIVRLENEFGLTPMARSRL